MQTPAILTKPTPAPRAQQHADRIKYWFESSGHWVYEYRADAVRTWRERGICGLPDHSATAEALLTDWVAADPLPALVAKWDAERAGVQA